MYGILLNPWYTIQNNINCMCRREREYCEIQ